MRISDWSSDVCSSDLDVGAERDIVAADRAGLEHRIEGRDLVRPHRRDAQVLGDRGDQLVAQPAAVGLLGGEQALDDRRTLAVGRELGEPVVDVRSEEHTSELQSLMRTSYADFCIKKQRSTKNYPHGNTTDYI